MTELELYKFIQNNSCEIHSQDKGEAFIFIDNYVLQEFVKLLPSSYFDDEGREIVAKHGYTCWSLTDI